MMRTLLVLALMLAAAVVPARAANGAAGIQAAWCVPTGDLADGAESGPGLGAFYYRSLTPRSGLLASFDRLRFAGSGAGEYRSYAAGLSGILLLPVAGNPYLPYLKGGLAYNWTDFSGLGIDVDRYGLGAIVGAGVVRGLGEGYLAGLGIDYRTFPSLQGNSAAGFVIGLTLSKSL